MGGPLRPHQSVANFSNRAGWRALGLQNTRPDVRPEFFTACQPVPPPFEVPETTIVERVMHKGRWKDKETPIKAGRVALQRDWVSFHSTQREYVTRRHTEMDKSDDGTDEYVVNPYLKAFLEPEMLADIEARPWRYRKGAQPPHSAAAADDPEDDGACNDDDDDDDVDRIAEDEKITQIDDAYIMVRKKHVVRETDVLLYGVTHEGYSVTAKLTNYQPYFMIRRLPEWTDEQVALLVHGFLPHAVCWCAPYDLEHRSCTHSHDFAYEIIDGHQMLEYRGDAPEQFIKVTVTEPSMVRKCRFFIERVNELDYYDQTERRERHQQWRAAGQQRKERPEKYLDPLWGDLEVFEADMPFVLRFGVDCNDYPEKWYSIPKSACRFEGAYLGDDRLHDPHANDGVTRLTRTQNELSCDHRCVRESPAYLQRTFARRVSMSFDIESRPYRSDPESDEGGTQFPKSRRDPVLQIGCVLSYRPFDPGTGLDDPLQSLKEEDHSVIFVVGRCHDFRRRNDLASQHVFCFRDERMMLAAFAAWLRTADIDLLTGYNIAGFDIEYLFERAAFLGVDSFPYWGKRIGVATRPEKEAFSSRAFNTIATLKAAMAGISWFDLLYVLKKKEKFRSYKLGWVANYYLGTTKEDVAPDDMPRLQRTAAGRTVLAIYCVKDALLVTQIVRKLKLIEETTMFARMIGCTFEQMYSRGMGLKGLSVLCRKAALKSVRYAYRTRPMQKKTAFDAATAAAAGGGGGGDDEDAWYEGAIVQEPEVGFYDDEDMFIPGLDFASLYPSIQQANNFCSSTWVRTDMVERLGLRPGIDVHRVKDFVRDAAPGAFQYVENPDNAWFVDKSKRLGLAPEALSDLAKERKLFKGKKAASVVGSFEYVLYDMSQLAVKYIMNSIYGLFGAKTSKFYCKPVAESVTLTGRGYITMTKCYVEHVFTRANTTLLRRELRDLYAKMQQSGEASKIPEPVQRYIFDHLDTIECPFDTRVIGGDTDSIYPLIRNVDIQQAGCWAWVMAKCCTKMYPPPNDLEFEKIYTRLIIYAKKRYVGTKWEWGYLMVDIDPDTMTRTYLSSLTLSQFKQLILAGDGTPPVVDDKAAAMTFTHRVCKRADGSAYDEWRWRDEDDVEHVVEDFKTQVEPWLRKGMYISKLVDVTGMESKRRDNCLLVSQGVGKVHYLLLTDPKRGLERAVEYVKERMVRPIVEGTVDYWQIILTSNLSKEPEAYGLVTTSSAASSGRTLSINYENDNDNDETPEYCGPLIYGDPVDGSGDEDVVLYERSGGQLSTQPFNDEELAAWRASDPVDDGDAEQDHEYDLFDFDFKVKDAHGFGGGANGAGDDDDDDDDDNDHDNDEEEPILPDDEQSALSTRKTAVLSNKKRRLMQMTSSTSLGERRRDPAGNEYVEGQKMSRRTGALGGQSVDRRPGVPGHVKLAARLEPRPPPGTRIPHVFVDKGPRTKISDCAEDPEVAERQGMRLNTRHYLKTIEDVMTRQFAPIFAAGIKDEKEVRRRVRVHLFEGEHMRSDQAARGDEATQLASLFGSLVVEESVCMRCPRVVADGTALCVECRLHHADEVAYELQERLRRLRSERVRLWQGCQACMGLSNEDAARHITCTNSTCEKYWTSRSVEKQLQSTRHKFNRLHGNEKVLNW